MAYFFPPPPITRLRANPNKIRDRNAPMQDFIQQLPKAELHVHLEGTLEPEHIFALAARNGIALPYKTPDEVVAAYDFHDLPLHYFRRAAAQNVVYVEPFFDPQAHTSRGVDFDTVINGIHRAQRDARETLGVESQLIMCFLRDMSAESAEEHLEMALPHIDKLVGVGLDSDEKDNPPSKFAEVFARARALGLKLTMHCDVNQKDIVAHIHECLELIEVDRIDHGVNALESDALCEEIARRGLGLTVCPVSNRFVVQNLTGDEIRDMLARGMKATINSDDPAYFRAYMNENLQALADEAGFSKEELLTLTRNAFEVSWLTEERKAAYLDRLAQVQ
jgi:adenosine deaminase